MAGLSGAEARTCAMELSERHGCSEGTIYALTADVRPGRKRRADAGMCDRMEQELEDRFLFLTTGKSLSTTRAREVFIREGHAMPSVATLNRVRCRYGLTARELGQDMRASVRFEAKHPNQLWQIDSTGSDMFLQDLDGSINYESPLKRTRNRSTQRKPHI